MQARLAQKTVLVLLMNSVLIPVLVNMAYKENLYGIEGLASDVYYFALTNAILSTAMKLFNISFMINRLFAWYNNWTCNKKDTNQLELNRSCEYMPF
jgi:membrane glycosyltransferase